MGGVDCPFQYRKEGLSTMNYFNYTKKFDIHRSLRIYQAVQNLKGYAITIYKNLWEDALDQAFFHILANYDEESGGDLEHYATKVVGTIMLGKYNHEIEFDLALDDGMNKKSAEDVSANPLNILLENEDQMQIRDFERCRKYLLPLFVQDYKFFMTMRQEYRRCSYTGIFDMFSSDVILYTIKYYARKYGRAMERLGSLRKGCRYRNFPGDRYKKSMDTSVEYRGMLSGTLLYKLLSRRGVKCFYLIDIRGMLNSIIQDCYLRESCEAHIVVEGVDIFCTLSGRIAVGMQEMRDALENDILGALLSKVSTFKVVRYERGVDMIISSTRETDMRFPVEVFGCTYYLDFERVPSKRVLERKLS